tara:strand:+ start:133 stop:495 length:363 start_codon:yes stop_codon:yes gene_type:complete
MSAIDKTVSDPSRFFQPQQVDRAAPDGMQQQSRDLTSPSDNSMAFSRAGGSKKNSIAAAGCSDGSSGGSAGGSSGAGKGSGNKRKGPLAKLFGGGNKSTMMTVATMELAALQLDYSQFLS